MRGQWRLNLEWRGTSSLPQLNIRVGCHCWLAQQWTPGTRFALLDEPAVAPENQAAAEYLCFGFVAARPRVELTSRSRLCRGREDRGRRLVLRGR